MRGLRAQGPIVPGAWMRVRLAWQVPRPIDDTWEAEPLALLRSLCARPLRRPVFASGQTWADPFNERPAPDVVGPRTSLFCRLDARIG